MTEPSALLTVFAALPSSPAPSDTSHHSSGRLPPATAAGAGEAIWMAKLIAARDELKAGGMDAFAGYIDQAIAEIQRNNKPVAPTRDGDLLCVVLADIDRLRVAMREACDLLAGRLHGSPARSEGHNARVRLEHALASSPHADAPKSRREGNVAMLAAYEARACIDTL